MGLLESQDLRVLRIDENNGLPIVWEGLNDRGFDYSIVNAPIGLPFMFRYSNLAYDTNFWLMQFPNESKWRLWGTVGMHTIRKFDYQVYGPHSKGTLPFTQLSPHVRDNLELGGYRMTDDPMTLMTEGTTVNYHDVNLFLNKTWCPKKTYEKTAPKFILGITPNGENAVGSMLLPQVRPSDRSNSRLKTLEIIRLENI